MSAYQPQWYSSPISYPAAQSGKLRIAHRFWKSETVPIIGLRQAILRQCEPVVGKIKEGQRLRYHELSEEGQGIWMTDLPEELNQIAEAVHIAEPEGRVLVGGLGLGILAASVAAEQRVESVTVVERNRDVIKLCGHNRHVAVKHLDIAKFLRNHLRPFDCYMLDTWQGTSERTWWSTVMPLRRIIRQRFGSLVSVHCWAEDMIRSQAKSALILCAAHDQDHWYFTKLPRMDESEAEFFVTCVGLPLWEKQYGKIIDAGRGKR